jgi:hypothetical protein
MRCEESQEAMRDASLDIRCNDGWPTDPLSMTYRWKNVATQARVFFNMDTQDLQDKTQPILCILSIHVGNRLSSDPNSGMG